MEDKTRQSQDKSLSIQNEIKDRLSNKMDLIHFELKDFTGRHLNHKTRFMI